MMSRHRTLWAIAASAVILAGVFVALWQKAAMYAGRSMPDYAQDRWSTFRYADRLDRESRNLAGASAIDCGRAPFEGPLKVNACVLAATKRNAPFRARYVVIAPDARMEKSLVKAADGRAYEITFMEGPYVPPEYRLQKEQCPQPLKLHTTEQASNEGGRLTCLADH
jgi:hypothetical protein